MSADEVNRNDLAILLANLIEPRGDLMKENLFYLATLSMIAVFTSLSTLSSHAEESGGTPVTTQPVQDDGKINQLRQEIKEDKKELKKDRTELRKLKRERKKAKAAAKTPVPEQKDGASPTHP